MLHRHLFGSHSRFVFLRLIHFVTLTHPLQYLLLASIQHHPQCHMQRWLALWTNPIDSSRTHIVQQRHHKLILLPKDDFLQRSPSKHILAIVINLIVRQPLLQLLQRLWRDSIFKFRCQLILELFLCIRIPRIVSALILLFHCIRILPIHHFATDIKRMFLFDPLQRQRLGNFLLHALHLLHELIHHLIVSQCHVVCLLLVGFCLFAQFDSTLFHFLRVLYHLS
mmetsp:Transcript_38036/g.60925  ORF Transcript_38036/g.60925 Transcript_38036/m.60925 type:complete len:224 (-) Transcript_38036:585-1256(-)